MKKPRWALALLLLATGCGVVGGGHDSPNNLDDACSIVSQRPNYLNAMRAAERRWGVPVSVQMATIHQESKFDGDARTPLRYALGIIPMGRQSSAYGYSQALDGTWDEYVAGPGRRRAQRDYIDDATDFMGWYMHQSYEGLGISKSDARNQYLAYHEGRTGFKRGSFNRKPWLLKVSDKVATRAANYEGQLRGCGRI